MTPSISQITDCILIYTHIIDYFQPLWYYLSNTLLEYLYLNINKLRHLTLYYIALTSNIIAEPLLLVVSKQAENLEIYCLSDYIHIRILLKY